MQDETTFPHVQTTCPECKHTEILYDSFHQETYCTRCGLVLHDTTLFQITRAIEEDKYRNFKFMLDLWRTRKKPRRQI